MADKRRPDVDATPVEVRRAGINLRGLPDADEIAAAERAAAEADKAARAEAEKQQAAERERIAQYHRNRNQREQSDIRRRTAWLGIAPQHAYLTEYNVTINRRAHMEPIGFEAYTNQRTIRDVTTRVDQVVEASFGVSRLAELGQASCMVAIGQASMEQAVDQLLLDMHTAVTERGLFDPQYRWTFPLSLGHRSYFISCVRVGYSNPRDHLVAFDCTSRGINRCVTVERGDTGGMLHDLCRAMISDAFPPLPLS